mgnify:CR=1 FL=1
MKVYGERNSGTNYALRVIAANTDAEVLPGGASGWARHLAHRLPPSGRERVLDAWDSRFWRRNAGWKHCFIDDEIAAWIRTADIRALAVTKHPMAWLVSLERSPYHLADGRHRALRRERLPVAADSLLDIWRLKTERYVELQRAGLIALVRSEDLLVDPEEALAPAFDALCLIRTATTWTDFERSVKHDPRSQTEIRGYYASETWRESLTGDHRQAYAQLDHDLLRSLGYLDEALD